MFLGLDYRRGRGSDVGHAGLAKSNAMKPDPNALRVLVWDIHATTTLDYHLKMIPLEFWRRCQGPPNQVAPSGTDLREGSSSDNE